MAATDRDPRPTVHDRLLGRGTAGDGSYTFDRLRKDILRDVQDLLNTRMPFVESIDHRFPLSAASILTFGRPELALLSIQQEMKGYAWKIKNALLRFDSRFQSVEMEILSTPTPDDRTLRLRIRAQLQVPAVERLDFDSEMDLGTGQIQLRRIQ